MEAKQALARKGADLPYFNKEAVCPMCGKTAVHQYLRDRSYIIKKREPDFFISDYQWVNPLHNRFNIYYFYLWHCPHCYYTDERQVFLKPEYRQGLGLFGSLQKAYRERARRDVAIQRLVRFITYPPESTTDLMNLHLLALYIQHLPGEYSRNVEKIARLYLRISWLFRMFEHHMEVRGLEESLNEFFKRQERLQGHYLNILHDLEELNNWVEQQVAQEKAQNGQAFWKLFEKELQQLYKNTLDQMDKFFALLQNFYALGETCKARLAQMDENVLEKPFFTFKTYRDFLKMLNTSNPVLPTDERRAIQGAIQYYRKIADSHSFDQSPLRYLAVLSLLSYLYEKVGDYYFALKYNEMLLNFASRALQETRQRIQSFSKLKDSEDTVKSLKVREKRLQQLIQENSPRREKLAARKWEWDEQRAREIFNRHRDASPQEIEQLLLDEHIDREIIDQFVASRRNEKKKGIFQIFKF